MKQAALGVMLVVAAGAARAEDARLDSDGILARPSVFRIESMRTRFTHYDQTGLGYQSQAGPTRGPGLEEVTVEQAQLEVVATQGDRLTHRLWVPLDVITAASPDAVDERPMDAMSHASRLNIAGNADLTTTYRADRNTDVFVRGGFHLEENFRSWNLGAGGTRRVADDNAVISASVNQVYDWFDTFQIHGERVGHASRSTTNANLGLTQLLSPTTVAHVEYGGTVQVGELSTTWNSVPLSSGVRGPEIMPRTRQRHAFVGRIAQWLPWSGAVKGFYRFYVDDWGVRAHTVDVELYQHLGRQAYLRLEYRLHSQSAVDFFAPQHDPGLGFRTADSDLGGFYAQTFGLKAVVDLNLASRFRRSVRDAVFDIGFERYVRSNSLRASILSCALGFRF